VCPKLRVAAKDKLFGVGRDCGTRIPRLHTNSWKPGAVHEGSMSGQYGMIGPDNLHLPERPTR
jgi:hypothetical protein